MNNREMLRAALATDEIISVYTIRLMLPWIHKHINIFILVVDSLLR